MSDSISGPSAPQPMQPLPGGPNQGGPGGMPPGGGGGLPPGLQQLLGGGMRPSMPGQGTQAGALIKLQQAVRLIQEAMMGLPIGSDMHRAAGKAVNDLSKHVSGSTPEGVQQTGGTDMIRNLVQSVLGNRVAGNQGGAPGMSPSMPLPGA